MGKPTLNIRETQEMFLRLAERMVASKQLLTQADKAIGDGDHGIGMARGFEAVQRVLSGQEFATLDELLRVIGTTLMTSIGGASGAIFGTFFRGGCGSLAGKSVFDTQALSLILVDGLEAVKHRGKAQVGGKTMVDALEPAAVAVQDHVGLSLDRALLAATAAARQGMESTKEMVATLGKARALGERSLGHADPGAISTCLILEAMTEYVTGEGQES
jgi:dihydroxyacetone kinase-like protein